MKSNIKAVVKTEKGALGALARTSIIKALTPEISEALNSLGFNQVEDKQEFVFSMTDNVGTEVYYILSGVVTLLHPNDRTKSKPKSSSPSAIIIE